jgi:UDP-N-acetylglucosamine 2-epimerase
VHRAENTNDPARLSGILGALKDIAKEVPVVLPLHPRTRQIIEASGGIAALEGINVLEPLSFLEMLRLEMSSKAILTDSGGVQKEAYFHRVPCITLRDETEWVETVEMGWNVLTGADGDAIVHAWQRLIAPFEVACVYGNGATGAKIVHHLSSESSIADDNSGYRSKLEM